MNPGSIAKMARHASSVVAHARTEQKNAVLREMAERLERYKDDLVAANSQDVKKAKKDALPPNMVNRLGFGEAKVRSRMRSLSKIAELPDPIGQKFSGDHRPNGLEVKRVRVPIGVILIIYEARPHVTVNAGAFCLKAGNAAILRGGSEAKDCNALLGELWRESLQKVGLPPESIQVVSGSHQAVGRLLQMDDMIDLVIPRGGKGLIKAISEQSRIPVIKHYEGICHVYLDATSDLEQALNIILDSKCLMPEVCNAMETLLVSQAMSEHLPKIVEALRQEGVTVKGCEKTRASVPDVKRATERDWRREYLDTIVSIRIVNDVDEAIVHINEYGSHHTDAIVTNSKGRARRFVQYVDSAVVLVNASTMFCDGEALGMGAEIGISTDKLHARGPMGLEELTSYKHVIHGEGHIMGERRFSAGEETEQHK